MVFTGGGGDEKEVKAYAQGLGLGGRVIFTGPVYDRDELRAWYSRADLLLFPSTFDTNGLVAKAYDRYGAVIDNYKSGVYGRRDPLAGSWMKSHGELMQILGDIESAGRSLIKDAEELHEDVDMHLRSIKNRVIVDAISAGYEVREGIREKLDRS